MIIINPGTGPVEDATLMNVAELVLSPYERGIVP